MWEHRNKVAIAGVGYSKLTRRSRRSLASITLEALDAAIDDAGLQRRDIDGLSTYPDMPRYGGEQGTVDGVDIVTTNLAGQLLGIDDRVSWAADTHGMVTQSFIDAVNAVAAGSCTYALVWRAVHVPEGRFNNFEDTHATGFPQFLAPYGFTMPAAWAAIAQARYFEVTGATRESFANYIVQNRENTNRNPRAYFYGQPLTVDDYMGARVVADPCCIYDCDIPIDGAAAVVLTTAERARDLRHTPALVTGQASSRHRPLQGSFPLMILEDMWEGAEESARRLWEASGLGPSNIDAAELYDGFSILTYMWLEGMGFAPRGEGWRFIDDGRAALTGELPINTSGCSLGEGRLHGMAHITEAALQVMGRAGDCQVPDAVHSVATIQTGSFGSRVFAFSRDGA